MATHVFFAIKSLSFESTIVKVTSMLSEYVLSFILIGITFPGCNSLRN